MLTCYSGKPQHFIYILLYLCGMLTYCRACSQLLRPVLVSGSRVIIPWSALDCSVCTAKGKSTGIHAPGLTAYLWMLYASQTVIAGVLSVTGSCTKAQEVHDLRQQLQHFVQWSRVILCSSGTFQTMYSIVCVQLGCLAS